ncbi:unnamed protein product [Mytilus edulis]|uniref:Reverse transcriptase/retrotransposon-derived protein RNase H-like domain-containing protein n=1 Tax=Mytilus edulis TaxID=6550 RepID=A0A8S3RXA0_MYTED|nr:unnamed protein product [Mytilus edulis]
MSCQLNTENVQTHKRLSLEPNTETIVWARVPNYIILGLQGVCSKSKFSCSKGLLVAQSVVTVPYNRKVPVKLLNPTSENVVIPKGRTIAEFNVLNKEYKCALFSDTIPEVQHIDISETIDSPHSEFTGSKLDYSKVKSLFILPENLQETESDKQAGLKSGPKKCSFAASSSVFLGHLISKDGFRPPSDRVKAISDYPRPKNIKELRRLLALFNWFRKFIPNYSALVFPLTRLLKKEQIFTWRSEQETAFEGLEHKLVNSDILSFPKFDLTFRLSVDTSARGIGYMLYQLDPDDETQKPRIIRFGSKSLSPWQQSYGPTKLELLGMVVSILDCADYLRGNYFIAECDHQALKPLYQNQFKGAIYERWMSILQQFSFEIVYKKADDMQVPDALSRCENSKAEVVESPVEDDPFFPFVDVVCR